VGPGGQRVRAGSGAWVGVREMGRVGEAGEERGAQGRERGRTWARSGPAEGGIPFSFSFFYFFPISISLIPFF
jgi:hypothetical protein